MALGEVPEIYDEPNASAVEVIPRKVLMQFISEFLTGYRTVFNLYTSEDKPREEIAQMLGTNERSSISQLFRIESALTKKVKEWLIING